MDVCDLLKRLPNDRRLLIEALVNQLSEIREPISANKGDEGVHDAGRDEGPGLSGDSEDDRNIGS